MSYFTFCLLVVSFCGGVPSRLEWQPVVMTELARERSSRPLQDNYCANFVWPCQKSSQEENKSCSWNAAPPARMKVSEAGRESVATKAALMVKMQPPHLHPPTHTHTHFDCKTLESEC